jgi:3-hydroxybutyrate dehydrogenase
MTEQDLAGRRALSTGGGSGIGLACAREFAARGAHVIVADRDRDAADAAAEAVSGESWVVDLSDVAALEDLTLDVDILVNNAGIQSVAPIEDVPAA